MVKSQKKLRPKDVYFNREKKINRLINRFMKFVFHANLNDLDVYDETNRLRLDIKMNLDMQSSLLRPARQVQDRLQHLEDKVLSGIHHKGL